MLPSAWPAAGCRRVSPLLLVAGLLGLVPIGKRHGKGGVALAVRLHPLHSSLACFIAAQLLWCWAARESVSSRLNCEWEERRIFSIGDTPFLHVRRVV